MDIFRSIAPFILIPLILLSTIGFSVEMHFCGKEIKNIGLYNAEPCQMEEKVITAEEFEKLPPCHQKNISQNRNNQKKDGYNQDNCCHNENFYFGTDISTQLDILESQEIGKIQAILIYSLLNFDFFQIERKVFNFKDYIPPNIDQNVMVLHQVFQI